MENNRKKNIIELMETDLYDLGLEYGQVCCLKKIGLQNIIDVLKYRNKDIFRNNLKDIKGVGKTKENYFNSKLLEYGINYNDQEQRQKLIDEYDTQKRLSNNNKTPEVEPDNMNKVEMKTDNIDIIELLDMAIEDFDFSIRTFNCLKRTGINTVYDVVINKNLRQIRNFGKIGFDELKEKILVYGIDLTDSVQCEKLIAEYDEKTHGEKYIEEKFGEIQDCKQEILDDLYLRKTTLRKMSIEIQRYKKLKTKLYESANRVRIYAEKLKALDCSKESSNDHGTK